MALDKAAVAHIARLARLRVEDKDLEPMAKELGGILSWIEQLNEVDTAGVEPMTSVVEVHLPRRADAVTDGGQAEKVLANATDARHGFFTVPKVVE
ncbi:MAG: Asp-tRNA(Asn)/Glu-tRNA(Gln) amidotransferase subunit GatC [Alphaproteobacteria bacterium]|nr:Asp-tRNA(Asn)/Glu-tRNA(Gln) amidotransferase subunit GatC [Alphaproteobacteria bacterium]